MRVAIAAAGVSLLGLLTIWSAPTSAQQPDLGPDRWGAADVARYDSLTRSWYRRVPLARGKTGIISSTSGASATRAGLEALKQGGTAIDAALTHAMADIVLMAGCCVSHAGFMTLVYYEAATGKVHSMNAGWNTVLGDTDPMSIPTDRPSGRTALVPGFMAGAEAAHRRFGKLPWSSLFGPAIELSERGFRLPGPIAGMMAAKKDVLSRLPATKAVFVRPDGSFPKAGELFQQPALAHTLRQVAKHGAAYMYTGDWARKLVAAVQADSGFMTMDDVARYEPIWSEPAHASYRGYDAFVIAPPTTGGVNLLEALNLAEAADLRSMGHYTESARALDALIGISRAADVFGSSIIGVLLGPRPKRIARHVGPLDLTPTARVSDAHAASLWARMQTPEWRALDREAVENLVRPGSDHSDAVVVADQYGNVAALLHTINTSLWGSTGIIIDGVSIADPGRGQSRIIARTGPGKRLPDPTNPLIMLRDGRPVIASSSIGMGLHEQTLQSLVNVVEYGMDPATASDTAHIFRPLGPAPPPSGVESGGAASQVVPREGFTPTLLEQVRSMGRGLTVVPERQGGSWHGAWVGIVFDSATKVWLGSAPRFYNGWAMGY